MTPMGAAWRRSRRWRVVSWDGRALVAGLDRVLAGGAGILWAEDGAGPWEAFLSGHPAKRRRSRWLLEETARRLGGSVNWATAYADGGIHYAPSYSAPPATSSSAGRTDRRSVQMPRELVVVDADGQLIGRMRVEARGELAHRGVSRRSM